MGQFASYAAVAAGKIASGLSAKNSAFDEARLLQQRGGQTRAASQRAANEERRAARLLISTARARAAAGGGSASDEGVINLIAEIDAQGEMNALTRLWEGEIEGRSDEEAADITKNQGRAALGGATLSSIGTLSEGSFAAKYG